MTSNQPRMAAPSSGPSNLLDRIDLALGAVEKRIAALSMLAILLGVFVAILARMARLPLPNTGELAIVAMAPLTFIGGAFCSAMHQHINVDVVDAFGSRGMRRLARMAASLAMTLFAWMYGWMSFSFFQYAWSSGERLIDLGTPLWIPVGCIVVGAALMTFHSAIDVVRQAIGSPRPGEAA